MPDIDGLIELPPEANPLTPQNLYSTLVNASSQYQLRIQTAAQQLSNWEKEPRYYSSLQTLMLDKSLPQVDVRYLAVIQLKNGIDKYWRRTAQNAIPKEEKAVIKSRCLEYGINEANHRLALQNALLVAKIVRHEFPNEWPDVMTSITQALRQTAHEDAGSVHLPRTLLILLYIIKELSTVRLQRIRSSLYKVTPEIFQVLASVYVHKVNSWLAFMKQGGNDEARAVSDIELSLLALRTLRRLLISGYEHPCRNEEVHEFWNVVRLHFGEILALVTENGERIPTQIRWFVEKHLIQISKIHLDMVRVHPSSFPQLPEAIEIARAYWSLLSKFGETYGAKAPFASEVADADDDEEPSYMEKLSLKALLLLRACVKMVYNPTQTFKFQLQQDREERKESTEAMKVKLLDQSLMLEMSSTLIALFFTYTPRDLRQWEEEPAEWEQHEAGGGDSWEFSIRLCAEKLFLDIVVNNKDLLIPGLLQQFHLVASPESKQILLKDAIYAAVGLAAPVLGEQLDFDQFMRTTLVADVQAQEVGYRLLRRRIAIMLGQWIVVKDIDRALVYQIFQHLLNQDDAMNDYVVQVTAGRQMSQVINTWDLQVTKFTPYAGSILDRLLGLVHEVELADTKLALLSAINSIVVRLELNVTAYADHVVSLLPPLWEQAGDEYLLKQTILGILSALVTSMKDESSRFQNLIAPLIESSVRPGSETREFLLDDAMDLWSSIVRQTTAPPPQQITDLLQFLLPLFELGSEVLVRAVEITEQYILLTPESVLKVAPQFATAFATLLDGNLRREVSGKIVRVIEVLLQMAHEMGDASGVQVVTGILVESRFLPQVLSGIKSAFDAHQTTGPNRAYTDIEGITETDYLAVLARILWSSPQVFAEAVSVSSDPFEKSVDWLLTEWFSHFQDMGNTERKKLMCLALTKLFELGLEKKIMDRLQDYISAWTDVTMECMEYDEENDSEGRDCLVYTDVDSFRYGGETEAPGDERRLKLLFFDPVHKVNIKDYVRYNLQKLVEACGGQEAFQRDWLVNVDVDVVKSFAKLNVI